MPKGTLPDVSHARIMNNSAEVPAQFTARASWDDGSVQTLDVDLNATLDPEEDRRYELQFGPAVTSSTAPSRGLALSPVEPPLLDAVLRLVGLLESPRDIAALSPLVLRELTYRVLTGAQGPRLRQIASAGAPAQPAAEPSS